MTQSNQTFESQNGIAPRFASPPRLLLHAIDFASSGSYDLIPELHPPGKVVTCIGISLVDSLSFQLLHRRSSTRTPAESLQETQCLTRVSHFHPRALYLILALTDQCASSCLAGGMQFLHALLF